MLDAEVRAALTGRPGAVVAEPRSTVRNARTGAVSCCRHARGACSTMLDAEADAARDRLTADAGPLATFDVTEALDRVPRAAGRPGGPDRRERRCGARAGGSSTSAAGSSGRCWCSAWSRRCSTRRPPRPRGCSGTRSLLTCGESLVAYRRSYRSDVTARRPRRPAAGRRDQPPVGAVPARPAGRRPHDLPDGPARRQQLAARARSAQRRLECPRPARLGRRPIGGARARRRTRGGRAPARCSRSAIWPHGWFTERPGGYVDAPSRPCGPPQVHDRHPTSGRRRHPPTGSRTAPTYAYGEPVTSGHTIAHLTPRALAHQDVPRPRSTSCPCPPTGAATSTGSATWSPTSPSTPPTTGSW